MYISIYIKGEEKNKQTFDVSTQKQQQKSATAILPLNWNVFA